MPPVSSTPACKHQPHPVQGSSATRATPCSAARPCAPGCPENRPEPAQQQFALSDAAAMTRGPSCRFADDEAVAWRDRRPPWEQIFYFQSRGIRKQWPALSDGFAGEVVDDISVELLRTRLHNYIYNRYSPRSEERAERRTSCERPGAPESLPMRHPYSTWPRSGATFRYPDDGARKPSCILTTPPPARSRRRCLTRCPVLRGDNVNVHRGCISERGLDQAYDGPPQSERLHPPA